MSGTVIELLMAACTALLLFGVIRWCCDEDLPFSDLVAWITSRRDIDQIIRARRRNEAYGRITRREPR